MELRLYPPKRGFAYIASSPVQPYSFSLPEAVYTVYNIIHSYTGTVQYCKLYTDDTVPGTQKYTKTQSRGPEALVHCPIVLSYSLTVLL